MERASAALLKQIEFCQKAIAIQLSQQCFAASPSQGLITARQIVLAVLWLALCEQRGIACRFKAGQWSDRLYQQVLERLQQVEVQLGQPFPFALSEDLLVADRLLWDLITSLLSPRTLLPADLLGQVYEQSLGWSISQDAKGRVGLTTSATHKKSNGIYYTPEAIVNYVVEHTIVAVQAFGEVLTEHFSNGAAVRVLDPACGGGAFLLAAYQRLLDRQHRVHHAVDCDNSELQRGPDGQWRLTQAARSRILQDQIYGVDLDPQAVAVTKLSLWLKLLEDLPDPTTQALPDLSHNLCCGNAVMNQEDGFKWEQEFGEVLRTGGFDVVIGNPPYIDAEWMSAHLLECRQYCGKHYRSARGNWDLFCVFIEKAIELCRGGGLVSLVVPNKLASADYASSVRQILSQETQLLVIRDYARVPVFAASVYPMVFMARKLGPKPGCQIDRCQTDLDQTDRLPVQYEVMQDLHQVQQARSLNLHSKLSSQGWQLTVNDQQSSLMTRLQREFATLGDVAEVRGAATVAEAYRIQPLIQNNGALAEGDLRVVNSGTIDRYQLLWGQKPLRYLGQLYPYPVIPSAQAGNLPTKRYQQAQQPKIIVAGMTQQLECALDPVGAVLAGKSTSVVWVEGDAIDLRYLLGLLNSQLLSFYFVHAFGGNRLQGGYLRIGPPQLRSLPIYIPDRSCGSGRREYQQMIEWVEERLEGIGKIGEVGEQLQSDIDNEIDRLVYRLYRLTDAEQDEFIELGLLPLRQLSGQKL